MASLLGDDVDGVEKAEKKTEETLDKNPNQECLSDFSAPHYNEVKVCGNIFFSEKIYCFYLFISLKHLLVTNV